MKLICKPALLIITASYTSFYESVTIYKKCLLRKYRKKLFKTDEVMKDLFEEVHRYQWINRH